MTLTSPSKYRNPVLVGVVAALIILGAGAAAVLWSGYVRDVEEAKTRADRFTRLLEEHTLRNIQAVDLVLQIVVDASSSELSDHDPEFEDWLRRRLKDLPHVRALFTIGPDGVITQHSDHPKEPRVTLADRSDLIYREQQAASGLHILPPLFSKAVNRWVLPASRQIGTEDENGGIVVAAVDPSFYDRFYSQLSLGERDAISLWHADGTLIARVPEDYGLVGERVPWAPVVSGRPEESAGTFIRSDPFDADEQWVVSYRAVPGMPLVVTTSLSRTAAVETWWQIVLLASISFSLLAGLAIATPALVFKRIREQEEAHHRTIVLQKFEALGQMTGGIAHDFNNVLAAIESGLHLLSGNVHDPAKAEVYVTAMKDALGRGTNLTAQLLGFAKRQDLEVHAVDANKLLTELEPILRHATGPGTRVVLEQTPNLPLCRIDETQFDAAILNLVMNARDAMPEGGQVTIKTELSVQQTRRADQLKPGTYVLVRVHDTGHGMAQEVASRVFEPYFTTKGSKGTGLGLSQVHGFMRQIGGGARIVSEPGEGTAVELYFPCDTNSSAKENAS